MDIYPIWFNLKDGVRDTDFAESARSYLDHLKEQGSIAGYRVTRRKLGLGPPQLPIWHITLDFENLAQMDSAFSRVSSRLIRWKAFTTPSTPRSRIFSSRSSGISPTATRVTGQEKFWRDRLRNGSLDNNRRGAASANRRAITPAH